MRVSRPSYPRRDLGNCLNSRLEYIAHRFRRPNRPHSSLYTAKRIMAASLNCIGEPIDFGAQRGHCVMQTLDLTE